MTNVVRRIHALALWARAACLAAIVWMFAAHAADAGTICGTVRDAATSQPILRAGVFVRFPAGAYTGYHAATDSGGAYCVTNVPPATYDLEFRVDNYVAAYVRNVVVTDDASDVDVALGRRRLDAFPNPAQAIVHLRIDVTQAPATLEVFDARGRFVRGWRAAELGVRSVSWDFRDVQGSPLPAGVYFLRFRTATGSETVRITHAR